MSSPRTNLPGTRNQGIRPLPLQPNHPIHPLHPNHPTKPMKPMKPHQIHFPDCFGDHKPRKPIEMLPVMTNTDIPTR